MDIRIIEQVRNDLVEMAQELLFFAHISNMACTEEPIYKVAQRIRLNIGMLSKIIEEEQPQQPQLEKYQPQQPQVKKYGGPFGWILNRY